MSKGTYCFAAALAAMMALASCAERTLDGDASVMDAPTGVDEPATADEPIGAQARGMTWELLAHDAALGVDHVGCGRACAPDEGDTKCTKKQPVLCLLRTGEPNPGVPVEDGHAWAAGILELTDRVSGDTLRSLEAGHELCARTFGDGWRMAEVGDDIRWGGWWAYGALETKKRFWVASRGPGNCWSR